MLTVMNLLVQARFFKLIVVKLEEESRRNSKQIHNTIAIMGPWYYVYIILCIHSSSPEEQRWTAYRALSMSAYKLALLC